MRLLIQRVTQATITIDAATQKSIGAGMVVYIGINKHDTLDLVPKAVERICKLNIFENKEGKLKQSLIDTHGDILIVSNFTLYGKNKKGNQLDFTDAGSYQSSKEIYESTISHLQATYPGTIQTGTFGAYMDIDSTVSGPVNIIIDISK